MQTGRAFCSKLLLRKHSMTQRGNRSMERRRNMVQPLRSKPVRVHSKELVL